MEFLNFGRIDGYSLHALETQLRALFDISSADDLKRLRAAILEGRIDGSNFYMDAENIGCVICQLTNCIATSSLCDDNSSVEFNFYKYRKVANESVGELYQKDIIAENEYGLAAYAGSTVYLEQFVQSIRPGDTPEYAPYRSNKDKLKFILYVLDKYVADNSIVLN